jgi:hypothetical protein
MNTNTIKKFKWFWAWQDEQEEAWLAEMAGQGLHLERVSLPGSYQFQKGDPANYVYRLDYQSLKKKDRESYLQLFADAGWEHVGDMTNWFYFRRKVQNGDTPDIYSDAESKIGKYYRIMFYMIILLPIMIMFGTNTSDHLGLFGSILKGFYALMVLFYAYAMVQLLRRMSQLKAKR